MFYAWPTWSPDSTKLAASRVTVEGSSVSFTVEVIDASNGATTKVYDNEPNSIPIAQGAPHYSYWSPDSKYLTFIASTPQELALFISAPEERGAPVRLMGQGPIYFSWADNSSALLMHRGPELLIASLSNEGSRPIRSLGTVGVGFRAPALSRDGSMMVFTSQDDGGDTLYVADTESLDSGRPEQSAAKSIMDVGPQSAFLWSPTREEVAVADVVNTAGPAFERLTVVSTDGSSQQLLVNEPLLAFFWSPDGEKIAYVGFDPDRRSFTWKYIERSGGSPKSMMEFSPSAEFVTLISFFDQYAYSNSIWSPDSSQIVFSGTIGSTSFRRNGDSPEGDKVYVVEVKEGASAREIASSRFSVWSWK